MWHKARCIENPVKFELSSKGLLIYFDMVTLKILINDDNLFAYIQIVSSSVNNYLQY